MFILTDTHIFHVKSLVCYKMSNDRVIKQKNIVNITYRYLKLFCV